MKKDILRGEWAVVTGASSGIGLEFTRRLGEMGCNVLMVSNQPEELKKWSAEVEADYSVKAPTLDVDLSSDEAPARVCAAVDALKVTPMLLINNAGIFDFKRVSDLSPRRIDLYLDLHIRSVTRLTCAMGERMTAAGRGYILNMSSMSCWMPMPGIALYSSTKAFIHAFSRAYRIEMISRGVSVTVACPGGIATDLFGLPKNLQKLAVRIGALVTPQKFTRRALRKTLRRKPQYINGLLNRISIVAIAGLPEWARKLGAKHLLDRINKK